jgi:hypothetical protein
MTQAVSHWPPSAEALVRSRLNASGICGGQSGAGTGFSLSSSFSPVSIIPLRLSILIYLGMNKRSVSGRSSET